MAVTTTFYNSYKAKLMNGANINLASDTIKVALTTASYTPSIDSNANFSDITSEISGTGYTAGGATLAGATVTQDNTDDEGVFDANDSAWTITTTVQPRYAIIYKSTGTASTSPLICYIDFGQTYTINNGTLTLTYNVEGIININ